jgi:hypothetical protein
MSKQVLYRGNYLNDMRPTMPNQEYVTAIEFEGELGKCFLKLFLLHELPFAVNWYSASLRGYQQASKVPDGVNLDMSDAVERWNWCIPENSSIHFCTTREERDANLVGE